MTVTAEDLRYLVNGRGRAAEVAIARLLDGGLIRISRTGLVSAIGRSTAASPLEARILDDLRHGSASLHEVRLAAITSREMSMPHEHLVGRDLLRARPSRRPRLYPWLFVIAAAVVAVGVMDGLRWDWLGGGAAMAVCALVLMNRDPGPMLTKAGRRITNEAMPTDRVVAVALHGLKRNARQFGLTDNALAVPAPRKNNRGKCGSGGGCGGGCGGGGCGGGGGGD